MYFFAGFYFNLTRFWAKLRVLMLCFPDFTENSNDPVFLANVNLLQWYLQLLEQGPLRGSI
jgi:hypothetical protein